MGGSRTPRKSQWMSKTARLKLARQVERALVGPLSLGDLIDHLGECTECQTLGSPWCKKASLLLLGDKATDPG